MRIYRIVGVELEPHHIRLLCRDEFSNTKGHLSRSLQHVAPLIQLLPSM